MKNILLIMYRRILAEALMKTFSGEPKLKLFTEYNYNMVSATVKVRSPDAILFEIPDDGKLDADQCAALWLSIRSESPDCRILVLCPAENELAREVTIGARHRGEIEDFVFYDVGIKYLSSKLRAL